MATTKTTEQEQEAGYAILDVHNASALTDTPRRLYISCGKLNRMFTLWSMPVNSVSIYATDNYLGNLSTNFETACRKASERGGKIYIDVDVDSLLEKRDLSTFQTGKHAGKLISDVAKEDPGFIAWIGNKIQETPGKLSQLQRNIMEYFPEAIAFLKEKAAEKLRGGTHVGNIGDKVELEATLLKQYKSNNYFYGTLTTSYMHTFQDVNKNVIVYSGTVNLIEKHQLEFNKAYKFTAKVKAHNEYNGILQKKISEPKF